MSTTNDGMDVPKDPKHDGTKGPSFRTFKRTFLNIARGKHAKDDMYSFSDCYHRRDEGGTGAGAPALPNQAGGAGGGINAAYTQAVKHRRIRQNEAYVWLYRCIDNESLRQMMSDLADTNPAELAADV